MAWKRINIPPVIIAGVVGIVVESSQGQQVAVSHRPPEEASASVSRRLRLIGNQSLKTPMVSLFESHYTVQSTFSS